MHSLMALDAGAAHRASVEAYADLLEGIRTRRRALDIDTGDLVLALLLSPATFGADALAYLTRAWGLGG